jgi:hypothetical protein
VGLPHMFWVSIWDDPRTISLSVLVVTFFP